ncbi:DUF4124 domain-containing protein [Stutzerimonas stutzeri]|uniref:DUF4124 domain-containing protein n=1 Tax=Stutzerimonas stutzeri TaxID=316 RepID=UPI0018B0C867|nr:DUF4124 domain-containing protein [Stutzerimonas stutzeri]
MLFLAACSAQAAIYQCPQPDGRVAFTDRPCEGAAESPGRKIEVRAPAAPTPSASDASDAKWEEARRFRFVEIPAIERDAAELMASPEPAKQALGREMAWQAQRGKEEFQRLERARKARDEINQRYERAIKDLGGR